MPFTKESAKKHKKGLSDKQSAQWAAIANSVLEKCIKDGGTDETCAPSAIRQANGVVGNQFYVNTANTDYEIRGVMHQGREHIVVPVVMMVEGVHSGSMGSYLYTANELGKYPESWNGIPVVIDHPKDDDGNNISANSPEIIDSSVTVGRIYNTHMVDTKLMAEAYLDKLKLSEMFPNALEAIVNRNPLEVSTGLFTDEDDVPGTWHNEEYNAVAINHRPDHLALLPGGTGACSWEDGCGIRVNQKTEDVPVVKHIVRTKFNNNSKGGKMDKKEDCGQCMEKIVAIIKGNAAGMTETDREWLLVQEEATLDKLLSKKPVEKKVDTNAGTDEMMKKKDCKEVSTHSELTSEQILKALSAEDKAALAFGRRQLAEKRASMIKGIQDNTSKELWPDVVLNTLSEDFLDKLYTSVKSDEEDVNYSLNGNSRYIDANAGEEECLYPVGVEFETKK
jgi:hypothetical protein